MQLLLSDEAVFDIAPLFVLAIAIGAFLDHTKPKIGEAFDVQAFHHIILLAFLEAFYNNIVVTDAFAGFFLCFAFFLVFGRCMRNGCYSCRFHKIVIAGFLFGGYTEAPLRHSVTVILNFRRDTAVKVQWNVKFALSAEASA